MTASVQASGPAGGEAQLRRLVERAVTLESEGDLDGAVSTYEEALLAGYATDEVCYNLALLYKQQLLYEDAVTLLKRCLDSPEYGASAHYASGECQLALGELAAAGEHFYTAVSRIALDQIADDQIPEVSHIFRVAIDTFTSLDQRHRAAELASTLADFLAARAQGTRDIAQLRGVAAALDTAAPPGASLPALDLQPPARDAAPPAHDGAQEDDAAAFEAFDEQPGFLEDSIGLSRARGSDRLQGTGRLRTAYRRLTGPLDPEQAAARVTRTGLLGRLGVTPTAVLPDERDAAPLAPYQFAPTILPAPVALPPTVPLPGELAQPGAVRALLSRALDDYRQGHFNAVVDDCEQVIVLAPEYLPAHLRLAEALAGLGYLNEAAAKCRELIGVYTALEEPASTIPVYRVLGALVADDLGPWTTMADLYFTHGGDPAVRVDIRALVERAAALGQLPVALDYADRLAGGGAGDSASLHLAARLHLEGGDPSRALGYYQALLRRDRNDAPATAGANIALTFSEGAIHWASLERLVALLGDAGGDARRRAIELYARVIPTAEGLAGNLQVAAGILALALGEPARARDFFLAAQRVGSGPLRATVRFVLAYGCKQAAAALGDSAAERQWLQRAAELLREREVAAFAARTALFGETLSVGALHVALAENLIASGKHDNAVIVLESAKVDLPADPTVRQRLAALYQAQGRLGQALDELDDLATQQLNAGRLIEMVDTLKQMSALAGDNLAVKSRLADLYLKRGFPAEALRELDAVAAIHQRAGRQVEAAEALRRGADTAWMIGERERAYALYDQVLALAPENVTLRQAYINCLLQGGRQAEAAEQQRTIARTFWEQRRPQDTIAALHQVIVLDPRDADSYNRLGEALASVGEYAQAERVYRRLVRLTPDDPQARARQTAMAMLAKEQRPA
ncbi:MAG TPA: tetratricopeptide repeat protein [Thermomicrobiales bacterium]|nr:tetratricopeptide repeat protein [Thermomicrobiales bacterium]